MSFTLVQLCETNCINNFSNVSRLIVFGNINVHVIVNTGSLPIVVVDSHIKHLDQHPLQNLRNLLLLYVKIVFLLSI